MANKVSFRRIRGKIVPILRDHGDTLARAGHIKIVATSTPAAVIAERAIDRDQRVKPNRWLQHGATAVAIGAGVVSGATFFSGIKGAVGGFLASEGLDIASTGLAIGAYAKSKAPLKTKAKLVAKEEAKNILIGNGAMLATMLAVPSIRRQAISKTTAAFKYAATKLGKFI